MGFHIFPTKGSWGQTPLVALGRQDQGWLWSFFKWFHLKRFFSVYISELKKGLFHVKIFRQTGLFKNCLLNEDDNDNEDEDDNGDDNE